MIWLRSVAPPHTFNPALLANKIHILTILAQLSSLTIFSIVLVNLDNFKIRSDCPVLIELMVVANRYQFWPVFPSFGRYFRSLLLKLSNWNYNV